MVQPIIKGLHCRKVTLYGLVLTDRSAGQVCPLHSLHTAVGTISGLFSVTFKQQLPHHTIELGDNVPNLELYFVPLPGKAVNHLLPAACSSIDHCSHHNLDN